MFMSESYSIAALLIPTWAAMAKLAAMTMQAAKIVFFIRLFLLVEVALSIRHDDVGSGFARRSVNDRRRHLHVSAIARNYSSPVRGSNKFQRNRFAGRHGMWAACRCAYDD